MALLIEPVHSLGQDDQNVVQHVFFGHVMPLALALPQHDANGIVNDTTVFLRARPHLLGNVTTLAPAFVSHDTDSIVNDTITFFLSRQFKWVATWLFW